MPLTIEQIREMIESFNQVTTAQIKRLTLSLEFETEQGESIVTSHSYQLEGVYPPREIADIGPQTVNPALCVLCDKPIDNDMDIGMCSNCWNEEYGNGAQYE